MERRSILKGLGLALVTPLEVVRDVAENAALQARLDTLAQNGPMLWNQWTRFIKRSEDYCKPTPGSRPGYPRKVSDESSYHHLGGSRPSEGTSSATEVAESIRAFAKRLANEVREGPSSLLFTSVASRC